ncbi:MAG: hypothetical protein CM15mP111_4870 [Hyphomicrobiales bacterium]|nr:MAG: hypothetical protein CM15mP111_4870 [Hyphomicrobiales bacterium]
MTLCIIGPPVSTFCIGQASMGSLLLGGEKGERFAPPTGVMVLNHLEFFWSGYDIERHAEDIIKIKRVNDFYF